MSWHLASPRRRPTPWLPALAAAVLAGCGGGTGSDADSGAAKTTLSVQASDADGQPLQYQWRVTGGRIDNRNAASTVWTLPDGPGIHFAYVLVADGHGGYAEQQYAVSGDALDTPAPPRAPVAYAPRPVSEPDGAMLRLRFVAAVDSLFTPPGGGAPARRTVYLPDVQVQLLNDGDGSTLFSGVSDLAGEVDLPRLQPGQTYTLRCGTDPAAPLATCATLGGSTTGSTLTLAPPSPAARNLQLFGHVALADGGVCGRQSEFFALQSAASVRLLAADGTPLGAPRHVNRFGDYALEAGVPVHAALRLEVRCEGESATLDVPAAPGAPGYVHGQPVELSHVLANRRPQVLKMVANGPDGNVRGRMIVPEPGASSNASPGADHFLTYKGRDTQRSACMYYRALGAAADCDAQGHLVAPISFDDWKRRHHFAPYGNTSGEVSAHYINKMDLNLVRRMVATKAADDDIAFYVCNHPGPDGSTQREVDDVLDTALADRQRVACVAMEWSPTPGAHGGRPFTKFLTFGPDGALLTSINLDGRGEKYMPGACVACHGGSGYAGRFPEQGDPSPYLGSGFLPFDTNNYLFGSAPALGEAAQGASLKALNELVAATESSPTSAVSSLVAGWYAHGGSVLDKAYLPPAWQAAQAQTPGAARFYHEVVGASCRTCHASLGPAFDWDTQVLSPARASRHVCGGSPDLALNASMPNALISRDRVLARVQADPALAALMTTFLGCSEPQPDPVYPQR